MFKKESIVCLLHRDIYSLSPSGCGSLRWGVSHTGSPSSFSSILGILHVELQVLHVVLDDVDPSLSLSSSAPLSAYVCLQDPLDTIILFSPLYMPIPSQPGLPFRLSTAPTEAKYSSAADMKLNVVNLLNSNPWARCPLVSHILQTIDKQRCLLCSSV